MDDVEFYRLPRIWNSPLAARWTHHPRPSILACAPIVVDGLEFQLHPAGQSAPAKAWRPIVAIKTGLPSQPDFDAAITGEIVDYAALSPSADRVLATMYGIEDVIGHPPDELFSDARGVRSIRLRRSPSLWLDDLQGAVLVRSLSDSADFLRQFDVIVADDVSHGEAIQVALRRDYAGPSIRVSAPPAGASAHRPREAA